MKSKQGQKEHSKPFGASFSAVSQHVTGSTTVTARRRAGDSGAAATSSALPFDQQTLVPAKNTSLEYYTLAMYFFSRR
jgi:hypothetical protein